MIAIKDMEMPINCMGCSEKCDPENRKCNINGHIFEETFGVITSHRDKDCPLVEIEDNTDNKEIYVVGSEDVNYMRVVKLSKEQHNVLAWLFDTFDGLEGFYCAKPEDCLTEISEVEE